MRKLSAPTLTVHGLAPYGDAEWWPAPIRWPRFEVKASSALESTPFAVHGRCTLPGCDGLVGEGSGPQAVQGRVRSTFVVVAAPVLDALAGIGQRQQPRGVQAFRSRTAVERLDCCRCRSACPVARSRTRPRSGRPIGRACARRTPAHCPPAGVSVDLAAGPRRRAPRSPGRRGSRLSACVSAPLACGHRRRSGSGTDGRRRCGRT